MGMKPIEPSLGFGGSFGADLVDAIRVWRRHPFLPLASLVVWAAPALVPVEPPWDSGIVVLFILLVGYPATERIWYQQAFAVEAVSPRELWNSVRHFFWPFLRLGILIGLVILIPGILLLPTAFRLTLPEDRIPFLLAVSMLVLMADIGLTFVVPALTFSTRKIHEALRIGLTMIRDDWPSSAWYAFAPPLALLLFVRAPLVSESIGPVLRFLAVVMATLMNLAFKGGIARYYLRRTADPSLR